MSKFFLILMQVVLCGLCFGQGKGVDDKELVAGRPSVFPEVDAAKLLCMESCPVEVTEFRGVKVLCGNFAKAEYESSCSGAGVETAEYCNCSTSDCAKFSVACTDNGSGVCHVRMTAQKLLPIACECGGRTCEQAAIDSLHSTCVIRRDAKTQICSLDSYGTLADGNALYTTCEAQNNCASEQVQTAVDNKPPMAVKKPSEPK